MREVKKTRKLAVTNLATEVAAEAGEEAVAEVASSQAPTSEDAAMRYNLMKRIKMNIRVKTRKMASCPRYHPPTSLNRIRYRQNPQAQEKRYFGRCPVAKHHLAQRRRRKSFLIKFFKPVSTRRPLMPTTRSSAICHLVRMEISHR